MGPFRLMRRGSVYGVSAVDIRGEGCVECGFSGYCDNDDRVIPANTDCSAPNRLEPPPDPDRYAREPWEPCVLENGFSGVFERRKKELSNGDGFAGAVGGDMAAGPDDGGALLNIDDGDGREKNGPDSRAGSRAGRSGSEPSIAEIDMLLPGRCAWLLEPSRDIRGPPGVWADWADGAREG
jgi:hypothetical protein